MLVAVSRDTRDTFTTSRQRLVCEMAGCHPLLPPPPPPTTTTTTTWIIASPGSQILTLRFSERARKPLESESFVPCGTFVVYASHMAASASLRCLPSARLRAPLIDKSLVALVRNEPVSFFASSRYRPIHPAAGNCIPSLSTRTTWYLAIPRCFIDSNCKLGRRLDHAVAESCSPWRKHAKWA